MSTPLTQAERTKLINKIYSKTHKDYKSNSNGVKKILMLENGGTCLAALPSLSDEKLLNLAK